MSTTPAPYELYDDLTPCAPTADTVSTPGSSAGSTSQLSSTGRRRGPAGELFGLRVSTPGSARSAPSLPIAATESTPLLVAYVTARRTASCTTAWPGWSLQVNSHGSTK